MKTVTFFIYPSNYILKAKHKKVATKITVERISKVTKKKQLKIFSKFHAIPVVLLQDSVAIYWSIRVTTCLFAGILVPVFLIIIKIIITSLKKHASNYWCFVV